MGKQVSGIHRRKFSRRSSAIRLVLALVDFRCRGAVLGWLITPVRSKSWRPKNAGTVKIGKVNIDNSPASAAQTYGVISIPTLMIFKQGEVVERFLSVCNQRPDCRKPWTP